MPLQTDPESTEIKALQRFVDFAGKRVLEVGCGDGRLTWRYANAAGRVTAIDMDADELRVAMIERPSQLVPRLSFVRADGVRLPFAAGSFDLAIFAWSF